MICRRRRAAALPLALLLWSSLPAPALAGGRLEVLDVTGDAPGPLPGTRIAAVVPIFWDERCLPPPHRLDATLDPIPNPLGPPVLALADAADAFRRAMARWNGIATSYAELSLAGTTPEPGPRGFDFVHHITFTTESGFGAIASAPSVSLAADATLLDGEDLDGDGDADVSAAIAACGDADGDGDVEMPAGSYRAGTILDSDVQLNTKASNGFRFTAGDAAVDAEVRSVDLEAVAVHELGHVLGLAHAVDNQLAPGDGTASTMYPFTDTGDPAAELAQRSLAADDAATASLAYPEGTAAAGPAALTPGDVPFAAVYGLLEGTVAAADGTPVAGAGVSARGASGGRLAAAAYSGRVRLLVDEDGAAVLADPAFHVLDGRWRLPVPAGLYHLGLEAVDGEPVDGGSVNFTVVVGARLGQQDFDEERWNGPREDGDEPRPGRALSVPAVAGALRRDFGFVTQRWRRDAPYGSRDTRGFTTAGPGFWYAVRFDGAAVAARLAAGELPVAGLFRTLIDDASVPVRFAEAALVAGRLRPDGSALLDLAAPLRRQAPFLAQDDDFAPLYLERPRQLAARLRRGVASGEIEHLFLVLRAPLDVPFPGVSGRPPVIGLDGPAAGNDVPIFGRSWFSSDGAAFFPDDRFNYMFGLAFTPDG
jgi:hypothetical protein